MDSTRQQQLLSTIKRVISTELRELDHETFHMVVVTHVLLSNDGRECRVWVDAPKTSIDILNKRYLREIQYKFMKQYVRKIVPKLIFVRDEGSIDRIDALLENLDDDQK